MKPLPLQTPAQLADHLRSFRKARGLTQAQLGRLVGIDQARMARIEKDPDRVSVNVLMKVLAALRVRVLLQPLDNCATVRLKRRGLDFQGTPAIGHGAGGRFFRNSPLTGNPECESGTALLGGFSVDSQTVA